MAKNVECVVEVRPPKPRDAGAVVGPVREGARRVPREARPREGKAPNLRVMF